MTPCFRQYFPNVANVALTSGAIEMVSPFHGTVILTATRPFIPFAGLGTAVSPFALDSIVNQKLFMSIFKDIATGAFNASKADATGIPDAQSILTPGTFSQYLYKLLDGTPENMTRFDMIHSIVFDYYNTASGLMTASDFNNALQRLYSALTKECDKNYFLAPGVYRFVNPSPVWIAYRDWKLANVNFTNLKTIELASL